MNELGEVFGDLRAHAGRTALTAISLFLGVLAVMAIIVTGDVVKEVFMATAEQQGGRYRTFARTVPLPATMSRASLASAITTLPGGGRAGNACTLNQASSVQVALAPRVDPARQQGVDGNASLLFVCGDYRAIYRLPLAQGRWLTPDPATSPYEVVVNELAAAELGGPGTTVWLVSNTTATSFPAAVVGVVNDGNAGSRVYASALPWLANAPQLLTLQSLTLLWYQAGATPEGVTLVTDDWLTDHGLPTDNNVQETDTVAGFQQFVTVMQWSFVGVAGVSLVVAALGIVNVGLASVKERTRELVIRRALGASKPTIVRLIMGSSLVLAVIVAAISVGVAWAALAIFRARIAYDSPIQPPGYPVVAALVGTSVAIATALLGSLVPGVVASRLQPGLALRD